MAYRSNQASSQNSADALTQTYRSDDASPADAALSIDISLKKLRFSNPENGFFIAEGEPLGDLNGLPEAPNLIDPKFQKSKITLRGVSPTVSDPSQVGHVLRCYGNWVSDSKYGLQFEVQYAQEIVPTSVEGLERYLGSGKIPGIGPAVAKAIVKKWGTDTIRVLDEEPQLLAQIKGLTAPRIQAIGELWKTKRSTVGLVAFLGLHGVGESKALRVIEEFGTEGLEARIRANPYMLTRVDGVGFKTADELALSLGIPADDPMRVQASLAHNLDERVNQGGDTAVPVAEWLDKCALELSLSRDQVQEVAQRLVNQHKIVLRSLPVKHRQQDGTIVSLMVSCVSPMKKAMAELDIAKDVISRHLTYKKEPDIALAKAFSLLHAPDCKLDSSQKRAALRILPSKLSILTGGPGTGKTTTLRALVEAYVAMGKSVVLAAPTGRAAKRMQEAIGMPASTMHLKLGYSPKDGFTKNASSPMSGDVFIVDEASMVDTEMAHAWLQAIPAQAHVLWVGDVDQLPSVGPGDILRNFMESGLVEVSRLSRVHRQVEGSGIASNAQLVLSGRAPHFDGDPWIDDFAFVATQSNQEMVGKIAELVSGLMDRGVPANDIQILSPQKGGDAGVDMLNHVLRPILNPGSAWDDDLPQFQIGDRLMVIKNDYDLQIFNGDMGIVEESDEDGVKLRMEDQRTVDIAQKGLKTLVMGYAITVHKSQGGERPVIIMVCSKSHLFSMNRNLLYTGITRGRSQVIMVGDKRAAVMAAMKEGNNVRTTGLVREILRLKSQQDQELSVRRAPPSP
jgi:exodeoxyribonuclease V alpha subunit